jgi:glucose/arabinose dehydrogenase
VDAGDTEVASTTTNFIVQQPPSGELQLQSVLDGLVFPSALVQANDGRVFFNERLTGNVRVVNISGPTWQLDPTPFCPALSISAAGEQGLLGLALDPDFSSNQSLYVFYTRAGFWNRVSRLTQSGSGCSETVIVDGLPTAGIHNGGIIRFGPDGKLYVITGDAGNPNDSQNVNLLAGKVLRVNPDGTAPPDNPFYLDGSGNRDKVYSLGHRNSFGFTFHAQTGDLWESENGSSDFDEVNRVVSGGNYGWDSTEQSGFLNRPCCRNPILALPIIAPTGIVTVPGNSSIYSPIYRNNLLMASFNDGAIRLVIPNPSNPDQPGTTSVAFGGGQGGLVGIMLGNDGYVYVTNHNFSTFNGSSIFRVIPH